VRAGDLVADRFAVERVAGSGGMGAVYRAIDRLSGQPAAIKVLGGADTGERFQREARLLAELRHPAIVQYLAHGTTQDGELFIAMEWLEGETLSQRLRRGPMSVGESIALVRRIADALALAHARGVVHRDIKPGNVLIVDGQIDRAKLLDFGVAQWRHRSAELTRTGVVLGTPGYMAPEQARGDGEVDARADVFALGCVLFQCLTGRAAFAGGGTVAVLAKLILDDAPRVRDFRPELPRELDVLVDRMLSKEPELRPENGASIVRELDLLELDPDEPLTAHEHAGDSALGGAELSVVSALLAADAVHVGDAPDTVTLREDLMALRTDQTRVDQQGRGALSGLVASLRETLGRQGARIEALRDGSVAVMISGAGSAKDLTARAARAALTLRSALPGAPMALATGRAVVSGRAPVGEVIERSAKLLAHARRAPRTTDVVVDRVTAGLLDERFEVGGGPDGTLLLKSERPERDSTRLLLGKPTTTVGRERELGFLLGVFEECVAEPLARVALVSGPVGIGKSRVRYEFLRRVALRDDAAEVWIARGDPIAAGSPFGLLGQVIRRAAGIFDGEQAAVACQKLRARVERHVSGEDVERVACFLGELARVAFDPAGNSQLHAARSDPILMGDQMLRAWQDFVAAECGAQPVVLVLEDLHWGDLPTVRFVDAALRNLAETPLMVLALARSEVHDQFPELWAQRDLQEIRLAGLTRRASQKLVREVLSDVADEALIARVVERADGNAFYLEELIRATVDGDADALPETVLAMVQTRLEALPEGARRVLRAAAIFGQTFWDRAVAELLGAPEEAAEVRDWLSVLSASELIAVRAQSRFPDNDEFVFRHALLREGAYAMLTAEDRALGHRLAGAWLEHHLEPDALVLAEHFERGSDAARALRWYRTAAELALDGNDFDAAVAAARRAGACAEQSGADDETVGALLDIEAEAGVWQGDHAQAIAAGRGAVLHLPLGSPDWWRALAALVTADHRSGNVTRTVEYAELLLSSGLVDADDPSAVNACTRVMVVLTQLGSFALADRLYTRLQAHAEAVSAHDPAAKARWHAGIAARALYGGDPERYLVNTVEAIESNERAGDLRNACVQRHNAGHASAELGAYEQAERYLRDVVDGAERMGLMNVLASAQNNLGFVLARRGERDAARVLLDKAIKMLSLQADRRMEGGARNHLADVLLDCGELEAAAEAAMRAVELLSSYPPLRVHALSTLARVLLAEGKVIDALNAARRAVELLDELGTTADGAAAARLVYAEALEQNGARGQARQVLARGRDRLLAQAGAMTREDLRQSFLTNVREHARTLELAREWGVEAPEETR
jgi:eukaryotic-like serine/threonine-protein kinase